METVLSWLHQAPMPWFRQTHGMNDCFECVIRMNQVLGAFDDRLPPFQPMALEGLCWCLEHHQAPDTVRQTLRQRLRQAESFGEMLHDRQFRPRPQTLSAMEQFLAWDQEPRHLRVEDCPAVDEALVIERTEEVWSPDLEDFRDYCQARAYWAHKADARPETFDFPLQDWIDWRRFQHRNPHYSGSFVRPRYGAATVSFLRVT